MRDSFSLTDDIFLATTDIRLSKYPVVVKKEKAEFSVNSLMAETGGALGLFLGLSILDIITLFAVALRHVRRLCIKKHAINSDKSTYEKQAVQERIRNADGFHIRRRILIAIPYSKV